MDVRLRDPSARPANPMTICWSDQKGSNIEANKLPKEEVTME